MAANGERGSLSKVTEQADQIGRQEVGQGTWKKKNGTLRTRGLGTRARQRAACWLRGKWIATDHLLTALGRFLNCKGGVRVSG